MVVKANATTTETERSLVKEIEALDCNLRLVFLSNEALRDPRTSHQLSRLHLQLVRPFFSPSKQDRTKSRWKITKQLIGGRFVMLLTTVFRRNRGRENMQTRRFVFEWFERRQNFLRAVKQQVDCKFANTIIY